CPGLTIVDALRAALLPATPTHAPGHRLARKLNRIAIEIVRHRIPLRAHASSPLTIPVRGCAGRPAEIPQPSTPAGLSDTNFPFSPQRSLASAEFAPPSMLTLRDVRSR